MAHASVGSGCRLRARGAACARADVSDYGATSAHGRPTTAGGTAAWAVFP
ncbi:hypothetical protein OAO87_04275 [bacterium]|nr:hypothetical protein [bacterium]